MGAWQVQAIAISWSLEIMCMCGHTCIPIVIVVVVAVVIMISAVQPGQDGFEFCVEFEFGVGMGWHGIC